MYYYTNLRISKNKVEEWDSELPILIPNKDIEDLIEFMFSLSIQVKDVYLKVEKEGNRASFLLTVSEKDYVSADFLKISKQRTELEKKYPPFTLEIAFLGTDHAVNEFMLISDGFTLKRKLVS